jgi:hypothetical protein
VSRKYDSYEDLISGLENEGLCDEDDVGSLDEEDLDVLLPDRHLPRPGPVKKPTFPSNRKRKR